MKYVFGKTAPHDLKKKKKKCNKEFSVKRRRAVDAAEEFCFKEADKKYMQVAGARSIYSAQFVKLRLNRFRF